MIVLKSVCFRSLPHAFNKVRNADSFRVLMQQLNTINKSSTRSYESLAKSFLPSAIPKSGIKIKCFSDSLFSSSTTPSGKFAEQKPLSGEIVFFLTLFAPLSASMNIIMIHTKAHNFPCFTIYNYVEHKNVIFVWRWLTCSAIVLVG